MENVKKNMDPVKSLMRDQKEESRKPEWMMSPTKSASTLTRGWGGPQTESMGYQFWDGVD